MKKMMQKKNRRSFPSIFDPKRFLFKFSISLKGFLSFKHPVHPITLPCNLFSKKKEPSIFLKILR